MKQTEIQWTDYTVNFWEGCQKVGPGCDHCYAEARDQRFTGGEHWGPGAPRRKVKGGVAKLRKIHREAEAFHAAHGRWPNVFCSSLSDMLDNAAPDPWRLEAWREMECATKTRIQIVTKRIGNAGKFLPIHWLDVGNWPQHIGLMITVVNDDEAKRDIPKLLEAKWRWGIPWVGLSIEPMLGPIDLETAWHGETALDAECWGDCGWCDGKLPPLWNCHRGNQTDAEYMRGQSGIDWVICGGESGHHARPMHPDWARSLRDQCEAASVPFFFKQWGEWLPWMDHGWPEWASQNGKIEDRHTLFPTDFDQDKSWDDGMWTIPEFEHCVFQRVGKKAAGRLLDGREWNETPTA